MKSTSVLNDSFCTCLVLNALGQSKDETVLHLFRTDSSPLSTLPQKVHIRSIGGYMKVLLEVSRSFSIRIGELPQLHDAGMV